MENDSKIWIYDERGSKFRRVQKSRCRRSDSFPAGTIKFYWRKDKWYFTSYGFTKEECWDRATKRLRNDIEEHRRQIDHLQSVMKSSYGTREEPENG